MNIDQQPLLVIHQPSELPNRKAYPLSRCKVCVTKGISPGTGGLSTLGDPAIHKAPSGEPHELVIHHEISRFLDPWIHHSSKPSWIALYKPVCVVKSLHTYMIEHVKQYIPHCVDLDCVELRYITMHCRTLHVQHYNCRLYTTYRSISAGFQKGSARSVWTNNDVASGRWPRAFWRCMQCFRQVLCNQSTMHICTACMGFNKPCKQVEKSWGKPILILTHTHKTRKWRRP